MLLLTACDRGGQRCGRSVLLVIVVELLLNFTANTIPSNATVWLFVIMCRQKRYCHCWHHHRRGDVGRLLFVITHTPSVSKTQSEHHLVDYVPSVAMISSFRSWLTVRVFIRTKQCTQRGAQIFLILDFVWCRRKVFHPGSNRSASFVVDSQLRVRGS